MDECSLISYLSIGLYLEPLLHPKPGAVTLFKSHRDKNIKDFMLHASIAQTALFKACHASRAGYNPLVVGLRSYRSDLSSLGLKKNIALGSMLLLLPLATALSASKNDLSLETLCSKAREFVMKYDGEEVAKEYYLVLELLRPSHLGSYEGPIPGVGSGKHPESLTSVLEIAKWDIVHRELLEGYPIALKTAFKLNIEGLKRRVLLKTLLELLASEGDTLIAAKYGWIAYKKALAEARLALWLSQKVGVLRTLRWLDSLWRPRGWSPGAVLDVLATAIGLAWLFRATSSLRTRNVL
ncbi:MAG: triphosphoribosyl-dephospho-CoA synthase [Acidilobaceae archaeon]